MDKSNTWQPMSHVKMLNHVIINRKNVLTNSYNIQQPLISQTHVSVCFHFYTRMPLMEQCELNYTAQR